MLITHAHTTLSIVYLSTVSIDTCCWCTGIEFISLAAVGYTVVVHMMDRFLVRQDPSSLLPPKQKFLDGTLAKDYNHVD